MLEIRDLSVTLGKKKILNNVSLQAQQGKIVALIGKNGSGKTTLLRALGSRLLKNSGDVIVNGLNARQLKDKEYEKQMAIMPQTLPKPAVSIEKLLEFGRYPYHDNEQISMEEKAEIEKVIHLLGFDEKKDDLVCHLSAGQRQLAYFGLLLVKNSEFNLLDEPASNLDIEVKKKLYQHLKLLRQDGKTILISLHDLNEAVELADELVLLEHGEVLFSGTCDEFVASDYVETVFHCQRKILMDETGKQYIIFK